MGKHPLALPEIPEEVVKAANDKYASSSADNSYSTSSKDYDMPETRSKGSSRFRALLLGSAAILVGVLVFSKIDDQDTNQLNQALTIDPPTNDTELETSVTEDELLQFIGSEILNESWDNVPTENISIRYENDDKITLPTKKRGIKQGNFQLRIDSFVSGQSMTITIRTNVSLEQQQTPKATLQDLISDRAFMVRNNLDSLPEFEVGAPIFPIFNANTETNHRHI